MQQHSGDATIPPVAVTEHCHKGRNSRSGCYETERIAHGGRPYEVAADRPPQFKLVAATKLFNEIWRNLAVLHSFHP
jgi:hypothetical protein